MSDDLTDKQIRFCQEYIIDSNATQAAIRAGYSIDTAKSIGCENLTKPDIKKHISTLRKKQAQRTEITADKVLKELAKVTFSDIRDYYNEDGTLKAIHQLSDNAAAALAGVDVDELFEMVNGSRVFTGYSKKIKIYDKVAGIEKLMKHLGLYEKDNDQAKDNVVHTFKIEMVPSGPPLANSEKEASDNL